MQDYHPMKSLAPRDVVARAIDNELKRSGQTCAWLDMRHHDREFLQRRFPNIFAKCLEANVDMSRDLIPVVPAAHFSCGGVKTDVNGYTGIPGLYAVGVDACDIYNGTYDYYLPGNTMGFCVNTGRMAGKYAADYAMSV